MTTYLIYNSESERYFSRDYSDGLISYNWVDDYSPISHWGPEEITSLCKMFHDDAGFDEALFEHLLAVPVVDNELFFTEALPMWKWHD